MRVSLHVADLHYDGNVLLHTASSGAVVHLSELYLRIQDDSTTGVGAVRTNIAYLNGLEPETVVDEAIELVGTLDWSRSPTELIAREPLWGRGRSAAARSLIDMALHDLTAKREGKSVAALLGTTRDNLVFKTNQTLFWSSSDTFLANARRYVERGFRELKVRLGVGTFSDDLKRIAVLRERFGDQIKIAADANGSWSAQTALDRLRALAEFELMYVEQPVAAGDWQTIESLADKSPIPIMLDESIASEEDIDRLCLLGGQMLGHLKLVKLGGIARTTSAARQLAAAGIPFMIGQMNEGAVCTAAALHVALATGPDHAELYGADGLIDDPARGITYSDGHVSLSERRGLGVDFDPTKTKLIREF